MDRWGYERISGLLRDELGEGCSVTPPDDDKDRRFVDISYPSDMQPADVLNALNDGGLVHREPRLGYESELVAVGGPRLRTLGLLPGLISFEDMNVQ